VFRERTARFKRPDNDVPIPRNLRNKEKKVVIGSRIQENSRKMKSPPCGYFIWST